MKFLAALLAALAAWLVVAQQAHGQAGLPTIQAVEGRISPSSSTPAVTPASSDELIVINKTTNKRESAAFSIDRDGNYLIVLTKDSSFISTPLTLRLRKGADTFSLLDSNDAPVEFLYAGTLLGSVRIEINASIGSKVASSAGTATAGTTPAPAAKPVNTNPDAVTCLSPKFDVNGDGKCDEADIEQIQNFLRTANPDPRGGGVSEARAEDVNGDGAVNVRDLLDAVRALQQARVDELRKGMAAERAKVERPAAPARPGTDISKELDAARSGARQRPTQPQ